MTRLYPLLRRVLFRLDAERAHRGAVAASGLAENLLTLLAVDARPPTSPRLSRRLLGLDFPNPIGLAAGFDKDAVAPHLWPLLGFGFAELGTVTALPQPGNPVPRMFRLEEDRALVNRLGFNGAGSEVVARHLARRLRRRPGIPIGINVGCSKVAMGDPAREEDDYATSVRRLAPFADYLAVNVSSPNTPGLRGLQDPSRLGSLVGTVRRDLEHVGRPGLPVLVKLAPDLPDEAVGEVCSAALEAGASGFIAGNTTLARPGVRSPLREQAGGLSGVPLRARATELVSLVRKAAGPGVPVVGVGGILTVGDVIEKMEAGADLVALYSGLVFEGPLLARRLALELDAELERRESGRLGRA
ncbi:MAG: quinone-dependent dihydroorotate dehydrogenase [Alphaproteobacteria bacterium]